jgi:hypothetical protein
MPPKIKLVGKLAQDIPGVVHPIPTKPPCEDKYILFDSETQPSGPNEGASWRGTLWSLGFHMGWPELLCQSYANGHPQACNIGQTLFYNIVESCNWGRVRTLTRGVYIIHWVGETPSTYCLDVLETETTYEFVSVSELYAVTATKTSVLKSLVDYIEEDNTIWVGQLAVFTGTMKEFISGAFKTVEESKNGNNFTVYFIFASSLDSLHLYIPRPKEGGGCEYLECETFLMKHWPVDPLYTHNVIAFVFDALADPTKICCCNCYASPEFDILRIIVSNTSEGPCEGGSSGWKYCPPPIVEGAGEVPVISTGCPCCSYRGHIIYDFPEMQDNCPEHNYIGKWYITYQTMDGETEHFETYGGSGVLENVNLHAPVTASVDVWGWSCAWDCFVTPYCTDVGPFIGTVQLEVDECIKDLKAISNECWSAAEGLDCNDVLDLACEVFLEAYEREK